MSGTLQHRGTTPRTRSDDPQSRAALTGVRAGFALVMVWAITGLCGCVVVDLSVTNPIPGLSTVAVAPFFNQSPERAVNGREVALAYYAELQKVPGFQVVPVGVTEVALREHNLDLSSPDDALRLAQILGVDAVVVGSITDFDPYYPPRIALTVNWYSPFPWVFRADLPDDVELEPVASDDPVDETATDDVDISDPDWNPKPASLPLRLWRRIWPLPLLRGQSPDAAAMPVEAPAPAAAPVTPAPDPTVAVPLFDMPVSTGTDSEEAVEVLPPPAPAPPDDGAPEMTTPEPALSDPAANPAITWPAPLETPPFSPVPKTIGPELNAAPVPVVIPFDPRKPLMSYTRLFDGADAEFAARLRDYLELRADLRSGSWAASLRRTDEFVRFAARLMISEMLLLHGGEGRHRYVFKRREH